MDIPEHVRRHWRVLSEIEQQSDRGAAIIGAAYIEERVTEAIRSRFVPGAKSDPDFLGSRGAGGTFAAKIDLAFLLGLVGPNAHRDLHLIRKIRNDFAHTVEPTTFNAEAISARCGELYLPSHILMLGATEEPKDPRGRFLAAVMLLFNLMWGEVAKRLPTQAATNTP